MRSRKFFAVLSAAALTVSLAGCSGKMEIGYGSTSESDDYSWSDPSDSTSGITSADPQPDEYVADNRVYINSATQLSMESGELSIHRRTRDEQPMGGSGWTILVYICGTDLESDYEAATADIMEAVNANYNDKVTIVFETGGARNWSAPISNSTIQRWQNTSANNLEMVDEIPDASMGAADTLADFVSWGVSNYPAEHMGLILWNHGGGSISGVCFDEKYDGDGLTLSEIDYALNSVYDTMTDKFEFIGFDACLMSTLETANILVPYARYMFASEEVEPGGGWNYTELLNYLAENPDADGEELGRVQCDSYYEHCAESGGTYSATFSITDLSRIDTLVSAFDETAKELYEYDNFSDIARAVYQADNFGGNNPNEGYTNMVDMKSFLIMVQPYASSASRTLTALENAVINNVTGIEHYGAGGLSMYYPLNFDGSTDLSVFSGICTSPYYLALVDSIGYGSTGGDVSGYSNSDIYGDSDDIWDEDYTPDYDPSTGSGSSDTLTGSVYFDDEGKYTVLLDDMSLFNYATCTLFMDINDGDMIYLGEDDEVDIDYGSNTIKDLFNGDWVALGNWPLPITTVSQTDERSIYTVPVKVNSVSTNLRIEYDWTEKCWKFIGTWDGIDSSTGAASRDVQPLYYGDIIELEYHMFTYYGKEERFYSDPITFTDDLDITYEELGEGKYYYSMALYDVYGNYYYTDTVTFTCDEYGELYYDPSELS